MRCRRGPWIRASTWWGWTMPDYPDRLALRVRPDLHDVADRLAEEATRTGIVPVSRSAILRRALDLGLAQIASDLDLDID